jgi:hypothetical protein
MMIALLCYHDDNTASNSSQQPNRSTLYGMTHCLVMLSVLIQFSLQFHVSNFDYFYTATKIPILSVYCTTVGLADGNFFILFCIFNREGEEVFGVKKNLIKKGNYLYKISSNRYMGSCLSPKKIRPLKF